MRRGLVIALVVASAMLGAVPASGAVRVSWKRDVGSWAHAVAVAPDGAVYVAAQRRISPSVGALLQKYTPGGRLLWSRRWLPSPGFASTRGQVIDVAPNGTVVWGGELFGQCEGGGWFLEWRTPGGGLIHRYKTPEWQCGRAEQIRDIVATNDQVVVAGFSHGCCSDPSSDGWIRAFGRDGRPTWETDIEPPAGTPHDWFDTATGLSLGGLGNIYVGGWAANERIRPDEAGSGTPILVKVTSGGGVLWTRRAHDRMFQFSGPVSVAARGDRIALVAPVRGRSMHWGSTSTPMGWLGTFDLGGTFQWATAWSTEPRHGAVPDGVALTGDGSAWVVGTMRDIFDRDLDMFVRRFGPGGALQGRFRLDPRSDAGGSGVALAAGGGVYAAGGRGPSPFEADGGVLLRLRG